MVNDAMCVATRLCYLSHVSMEGHSHSGCCVFCVRLQIYLGDGGKHRISAVKQDQQSMQ